MFLFIAHDGFAQPDLWEYFFKSKGALEFGAVIFTDPGRTSSFDSFFIKNFHFIELSTTYGYGDLLPNTLIAFAVALDKYPQMKHAYLIPGNCIPVKPIQWYSKVRSKSLVCFETDYQETIKSSKRPLIVYSGAFVIIKKHMEFMISHHVELISYPSYLYNGRTR